MDEDEEISELRAQEARRVREEAKNACGMPASNWVKRLTKSTNTLKNSALPAYLLGGK